MNSRHNMFFRVVQPRRFRPFKIGKDSEDMRFSIHWPDVVEVPSHIMNNSGLVPNPDYEAAQFEEGYLAIFD